MIQTGAVEGQQFIKTGKLVALSAQNLIDCDFQSFGCSGGYLDDAFGYIERNGGIDSASSYPYEGLVSAHELIRSLLGLMDIKYFQGRSVSFQCIQCSGYYNRTRLR